MKSLHVPFIEKDDGVKALEAAIDIAKVFSAQIFATHIRPHPEATIPYGMDAMLISYLNDTTAQMIEAGKKWEQDLRAAFEAACAAKQIPVAVDGAAIDADTVTAHWKSCLGAPDRDYGKLGRVHDLTVIRQKADEVGIRIDTLESIMFGSGRPTLLVPHEGKVNLTGTGLIAWNGSIEAARALSQGLGLLRKCQKVVILTVGRLDDNAPSPEEVAAYLASHAISATVISVDKPKGSIEDEVVAQMTAHAVDVVVMGAYTHSRIQEFIFGGVTRYMVKDAHIPILMTH